MFDGTRVEITTNYDRFRLGILKVGPGTGVDVLVVDDEDSVVQTTEMALNHRGHNVVTATKADKAIDACIAAFTGGKPLDVVFQDIKLEQDGKVGRDPTVVDGLHLAGLYSALFPESSIVLQTAFGREYVHNQSTYVEDTGIVALLEKGEDLMDLTRPAIINAVGGYHKLMRDLRQELEHRFEYLINLRTEFGRVERGLAEGSLEQRAEEVDDDSQASAVVVIKDGALQDEALLDALRKPVVEIGDYNGLEMSKFVEDGGLFTKIEAMIRDVDMNNTDLGRKFGHLSTQITAIDDAATEARKYWRQLQHELSRETPIEQNIREALVGVRTALDTYYASNEYEQLARDPELFYLRARPGADPAEAVPSNAITPLNLTLYLNRNLPEMVNLEIDYQGEDGALYDSRQVWRLSNVTNVLARSLFQDAVGGMEELPESLDIHLEFSQDCESPTSGDVNHYSRLRLWVEAPEDHTRHERLSRGGTVMPLGTKVARAISDTISPDSTVKHYLKTGKTEGMGVELYFPQGTFDAPEGAESPYENLPRE